MMAPHIKIVSREDGLVEVSPRREKLLILGATETWHDAPIADDTYEVWGLNDFWPWWRDYATRWFEIHPLSILRKEPKRFGDPIKALKNSSVPVYMIRPYAHIPMSVRYPIERVQTGHFRLFTSTFCHQLALAVYESFSEIGIYGVDFSRGSVREQTVEWRGIAYWLGLAEGLGIKITGPTQLLHHRYLYGIDYWREVDDTRRQLAVLREQKTDGAKNSWRKKRQR